jgi:hypothetical protein
MTVIHHSDLIQLPTLLLVVLDKKRRWFLHRTLSHTCMPQCQRLNIFQARVTSNGEVGEAGLVLSLPKEREWERGRVTEGGGTFSSLPAVRGGCAPLEEWWVM